MKADRTFGVVAVVTLVAMAATGVVLRSLRDLEFRTIEDWGLPFLVFLVLFVLAEGYPVRLLGRDDGGEFTTSATFGFALLLTAPLPAALCAVAVGTLIGDRWPGRNKPWLRTVFNVGQVVLSVTAAGLVLDAMGVELQRDLPPSAVLGLVIAGVAMYLVNILLTSIVIALDRSVPLWTVVMRDLASFGLVTHFLQLGFAPVFVLVLEHNVLLMPVLLLSVVATYRSTRTAIAGKHDSRHDVLTGLPNRRLLDERLVHLTTDPRQDQTFALLLLDLDRFKTINDILGHHVGDLLLTELAGRLSALDRLDIVARVGGDEFALIVRDAASNATLEAIVELIVGTVTAPYRIHDVPLQVGVSVGVARFPDDCEEVPDLMRRADSAMYAAKQAGQPVRFSTPERRKAPGRLALVGDLEKALENAELQLYYQPQISLPTGRVVGLEALLRWHHPTHGIVAPATFLNTAEHTELLPILSRYVLELALRDHCRRDSVGVARRMSVNVSARDLQDRRLPRDLGELLDRHEVASDLLTLEITGNALHDDPQRAHQVVSELRDLGVGLSLDDFGTGYSSLITLRDLLVTELKIERSFISAMGHSPANGRIVRSMIGLAHELELGVVAEGVERPAELLELSLHGCDTVQGYLLSRPLPPEQTLDWLIANPVVDLPSFGHAPQPASIRTS